jgi:hypothetical protein
VLSVKEDMKRGIVFLFFLVLGWVRLEAQLNVPGYLWEYPLEQNLSVNPELQLLVQGEMQKVIDSGTLFFRPATCRYSDQIYESYFLYQEPGRILQTIALAYPYLTVNQQTVIRSMVPSLLASSIHAPWAATPQARDAGTRREFYLADSIWGGNSGFGYYRPSVQGVYSLWLYMYRTGDTAVIQPYYEDIRSFYNSKVGGGVDPGNLYGTMSAHIGMARLAQLFNDSVQVEIAASHLSNFLNLGLNIHYVDSMAFYGRQGWDAPYGSEYDSRRDNYIYRGFIFLNMSPEIGRYITDTVFSDVMQRHNSGLTAFPFWWLLEAPYFVRWTGDEGVGIPSEMFGMVMPVERWVIHRDPETMRSYMQSSPSGIGDCYWIESLVYALESDAEDSWVDVRITPFTTDGSAVPVMTAVNLNVQPGTDTCFAATQTIVTGGNGQQFSVQPGGGATLVAGQNILLKSGTIVSRYGYLSCRISSDGSYCSMNPAIPSIANNQESLPADFGLQEREQHSVRIYPNPATGLISIEINQDEKIAVANLQITNMIGEIILQMPLPSGNLHRVDISGFCPGLYLILVTAGDEIYTGKIIRQ